MVNRRDLLLQEMNITQWILTKPQFLKGDARIHISEYIKLVVIGEDDHQSSRLFNDILRSLRLSEEQYKWVNFEQSTRLYFKHTPLIWILKSENSENQQQVVQLQQQFTNSTIWHHHSWNDLTHSVSKRQFWQQIEPFCQEENI